jgi:hypothetical protein
MNSSELSDIIPSAANLFSQFLTRIGRELSDCIPPASNFLFLVAVLKKIDEEGLYGMHFACNFHS